MNRQWTKSEQLTWCSHCHIEKERIPLLAPGGRGAGGEGDPLPVYFKTGIPARWYKQSVFNHGSHRMMGCAECHDRNAAGVKVADSKTTEDILLPNMQSCMECHHSRGGARNACVECHRYHDRTQERSPDGLLKLQDAVWKNR